MARSSEFAPKIRSTRVPVHLSSPVVRSRPSNSFSSSEVVCPRRVQIEQVDEEIVGQSFRAFGENAVLRTVVVRVENAHSADENRHFGRGQRQKLRSVNQHFFSRRFVMRFRVVAEAVSQRFEISERIARRFSPATHRRVPA